MNDPDLAAQVVDRVKTINFGAEEGVQAVTITYPNRLPAGGVMTVPREMQTGD